jgi:hypothetical protein
MTLRRLFHGRHRPLGRRLDRYSTRMLSGRPRPSRPNYLRLAVRAVRDLLCCRKRLVKLDPDLFDYAKMQRQAVEAAYRREWDVTMASALDRIYGPTNP